MIGSQVSASVFNKFELIKYYYVIISKVNTDVEHIKSKLFKISNEICILHHRSTSENFVITTENYSGYVDLHLNVIETKEFTNEISDLVYLLENRNDYTLIGRADFFQ